MYTGYTTTYLETETSNAFAYKYVYNPDGNIYAIQNGTKQSDGSYSYSTATGNVYTYDRYNQLIRDLDKDNGTSTHYEYDINGNITKRIVDKWDVENNVRISNLITDYFTYNDSKHWGDLLTRYTESGARPVVECNLTYDEIGNPLNYRDGITMTWQNGRELATFTKGMNNASYTYDPSGLRTGKTVLEDFVTTDYKYVYENGLLIQMTFGNHIYNFTYDANGTPVSFASSSCV